MDNIEGKKQNRFFIFILSVIILEAALFSAGNNKIINEIKLEAEHDITIQKSLESLTLGAKAVSVYNISASKKVWGINDQTPMPLASLAKTMTVVVSLNHHKTNDEVYIPLSAIAEKGDYGMFGNERWYLSDLARSTLIASANDGAMALTAGNPRFVEDMNDKAKKLGMQNTLFINPTGLDVDTTHAGGFISAEDANTMASYAIRAYPQIFYVTALPELNIVSLSNFNHTFINTDTVIDKIPNLIFSKTGFTDIAGGNLTIIFKNNTGEEIAVTVLGSTYKGRFTDMENIVNTLYNL